MDWPVVVLLSVVIAAGVTVYGLRVWRSGHVATVDVAEVRDSVSAAHSVAAAHASRLAKLEHVLRIDGAKAMAEANKGALPGFMRMAVMFVGVGIALASVLG